MNSAKPRVTVIGGGHVGFPTAVLLSLYGMVTVLDPDADKVARIRRGEPPVCDETVSRFLGTHTLRLSATSDWAEGCKNADFVIIAAPTDYDAVRQALDTSSVERAVAAAVSFSPEAVVIIKSTVPIGFADRLHARYGRTHILSAPEFLREGCAMPDCLRPPRIVLGVPDDPGCMAAADRYLELLLKCVEPENTPVFRMSPSEAESVKLFSNGYLAMRVAFFNELDSFAESRGLRTQTIIDGICADPRMGNYYNRPSFGYGGYCLPKDTEQLMGHCSGVPCSLIPAVHEANQKRKAYIARLIMARKRYPVGICRLTSKENSDNFRESAVLSIIALLRENGIPVLIFEPLVQENYFMGCEVVRDWDRFVSDSGIIVADRYSPLLDVCPEKVFTRDTNTFDGSAES